MIDIQRKILLVALIGLISYVIALSGFQTIQGAVTLEMPVVLFSMQMENDPTTSMNEVLYERGAYSIRTYKNTKAWLFDGNTDYVITSSKDLAALDSFTVMFWFKPSSLTLFRRAHMIWQGDLGTESNGQFAGNGWGDQQEMHISLGNELGYYDYEKNVLTFYLGDEKNHVTLSEPFKTTNWNHVAVTVKNGVYAEMFLNGKSVATQQFSTPINRNKWGTLYLGKSAQDGPAGDTNRYYGGALDELAIYEGILSSEKISRMCQSQHLGKVC